jgi:hypothetical protein
MQTKPNLWPMLADFVESLKETPDEQPAVLANIRRRHGEAAAAWAESVWAEADVAPKLTRKEAAFAEAEAEEVAARAAKAAPSPRELNEERLAREAEKPDPKPPAKPLPPPEEEPLPLAEEAAGEQTRHKAESTEGKGKAEPAAEPEPPPRREFKASPPPLILSAGQPRTWAQMFQRDRCWEGEQQTVRYWHGDWWRWDGECYKKLNIVDVKAEVINWLDRARRLSGND